MSMMPVALRKESVDRNSIVLASFRACIVALRKESVDRNCVDFVRIRFLLGSLSARRAWIEIIGVSVGRAAAEGRSPQGERG